MTKSVLQVEMVVTQMSNVYSIESGQLPFCLPISYIHLICKDMFDV